MALQNLHIRSNEYEVYLGSLQGRYSAEAMEGVRSTSMMGCHMISIVHLEGIGDHGLIGLVGLLNVEVACNYCRVAAHDFLNLLHDELCTLLACCDSHVVIMGIDGHEDASSSLVLEFDITGYTFYSSIPSLGTRDIGRLAQPEIALVQSLVLVLKVKDRRKLTFLLAIGSAYSHIVIVLEVISQILELLEGNLLHTHDIYLVVKHILGHTLLA